MSKNKDEMRLKTTRANWFGWNKLNPDLDFITEVAKQAEESVEAVRENPSDRALEIAEQMIYKAIHPYTEEEINAMLDKKDSHGNPINIFDLYAVLYVGNLQGAKWDLTHKFQYESSFRIPITLDQFAFCYTEDDVSTVFCELLGEGIAEEYGVDINE